jgi:creatinine amidohydrolase
MEKVRYAEMLPHEIVSRRKKFPAAFIALGGLEWHGEHLAVGNDALKAQKLCELAAAESGGFAMPTLWYGEPRTVSLMEANYDADGRIASLMALPHEKFSAKHLGKSDAEQVAFYEQVVFHVLVQMNTLGMKAVCFVSGHYPLKQWADKAIKRFGRIKRHRSTRAFCGIEFHYPRPENHKKAGGDHAAQWETSYLWYLRPDCVDMSIFRGRESEKLVGVLGQDPRVHASIELGRRACRLIVRGMVAKARQLIAESKDR